MTTDRAPTDPRISRRRRTVARGRKKKLLVRLAVVAGLGLVGWIAFRSPILSVRHIRVVGARHVTANEVARVTSLKGDNLLSLSTGAAVRAVERLPWVKKAQVDRILPGTVRVRIVERRPALALTMDGERAGVLDRWLIDARGRVLAPTQGTARLPVLAGIPAEPVTPGTVLRGREATAALTAYRRMPRSLRARIDGVFAPTLERITFSLEGRTLVRYGAAEGLAAKNAVLRALLVRLGREGRTVAYIDVRVPSSPAVSTAPPAALTDVQT